MERQVNGPKDEKKTIETPETKETEDNDDNHPTDGVTDHRLDLDEDGWADP